MRDRPFREVEQVGWFQRIVSSIGGVIIGIILFIGSFFLLFWNEGNAVDSARKVYKSAMDVIPVPVDRVNPDNDGQLVYVTGMAGTSETLKDEDFEVAVKALRLRRIVEIYQWQEEKQAGTRNTYQKAWTSAPINSANFNEPDAHRNTGHKLFQDMTLKARAIKLGEFDLSPGLTDKITEEKRLTYTNDLLSKLSSYQRTNLRVRDGLLYRSVNPSESSGEPQIGDLRIEFREVKPVIVSIVARQRNKTLALETGGVGDLLRVGTFSKDDLFQNVQQDLSIKTWVWRLAGFLLMAIGIALAFQPLVIFADVIPFVGNLIGLGVGVFALGIAFVLSMATIAISWIYLRPLLGIGLLIVAGGALAVLGMMSRKRQEEIESK